MKRFLKILFIILIFIFSLISCKTTPKITNISPALLYSKPVTYVFKDPDFHLNDYKTFSVFPLSIISKEEKMNPILEKQLLFQVRNCFEAKGYNFVSSNQDPDFLVTIGANSEYHETYIPPSTITLPSWVPGRTIKTYSSSSGNFNINTFGQDSTYGWGNWIAQGNKTTYVPGHMTSQTYTKPGYTVGHYYPSISVQLYDGETLKNVWMGSGVGISNNLDIRISGQLVLNDTLKEFPWSSKIAVISNKNIRHKRDLNKKTRLGIYFGINTNDGNSYFPTVWGFLENNPAQSAGITKADMIIEINGTSTLNKSLSEVINLLRQAEDSDLNIKLKRLDKILNFTFSS